MHREWQTNLSLMQMVSLMMICLSQGEDFFSANGVGGGSAPTSQPYIVTVTSTSGSAVSNFKVLGSYEYLNNSGFTAGRRPCNWFNHYFKWNFRYHIP